LQIAGRYQENAHYSKSILSEWTELQDRGQTLFGKALQIISSLVSSEFGWRGGDFFKERTSWIWK